MIIETMELFETTLENFNSKLWGYHFPVPEEIAQKYIEGANRRVICLINSNYKMHCALMPYTAGHFILINKDLVKRFDLKLGEKVSLGIEKDTSTFGREVPESFLVLLEQDETGKSFFQALTPGKQRSLVYLVSKVKNIDSQLSKGLAILDHLKREKGALDFKKLNEIIKEYNQRAKLKK